MHFKRKFVIKTSYLPPPPGLLKFPCIYIMKNPEGRGEKFEIKCQVRDTNHFFHFN